MGSRDGQEKRKVKVHLPSEETLILAEDGERSAGVQGFCRGLRAAEPPGPHRRPTR